MVMFDIDTLDNAPLTSLEDSYFSPLDFRRRRGVHILDVQNALDSHVLCLDIPR